MNDCDDRVTRLEIVLVIHTVIIVALIMYMGIITEGLGDKAQSKGWIGLDIKRGKPGSVFVAVKDRRLRHEVKLLRGQVESNAAVLDTLSRVVASGAWPPPKGE